MSAAFAVVSGAAFWAACVTAAAPLMLGTVGAQVCGRAGVLPLAADGILAASAAAAFVASGFGAEPWTALAVAVTVGLVIGGAHGVLIGPLGLSQPLVGVGILLVTLGGGQIILGAAAPESGPAFAAIDLPQLAQLLAQLPFGTMIQDVLHQPPTVPLAVVIVLAVGYVSAATPFGLALRACGEAPEAIAAQGRSVGLARIVAATAGSALMALAGASLVLVEAASRAGAFEGRGFVWLALAAAARWRMPSAVAFAALMAVLQTALAAAPAAPGLARLVPVLPYAVAAAAFIMVRGHGSRFAPRR